MINALLLLATTVTTAASHKVTFTPWCANSLRVHVTPSTPVDAKLLALRTQLRKTLDAHQRSELPTALIRENCGPPAAAQTLAPGEATANGNLQATVGTDGRISFSAVDSGKTLFVATPSFAPADDGYLSANLSLAASDKEERVFGLGQGNWTSEGGCPSGKQHVVPLLRNGQRVNLQQRKFHVSIPFVYSSVGYGFLFNMPGYGSVDVGALGTGGMSWQAEATALGLDFWVTALPHAASHAAEPIYSQYADATGHAPPLREEAMIFWQSRNRYKSSAIAMGVADRYAALKLPVGVLVIDYKNQVHDGDFAPDAACYPSVSNLTHYVANTLHNATTVFSFWPEVLKGAKEEATLRAAGCLINPDLGGRAIDPTPPSCRELIWTQFLKPRYYDQGVSAYWLDETDGEGTGVGDGDHGYDTSFGPAKAYSQLWVNDWLATFSDPIAKAGHPPLLLTRGVWAGGQRHGVVLWSSDIWSSFEQLASMVPQGVHASLSGIPWWTTDVGGYGCGFSKPNDSPYMQELIVRWYEFGLFCPVFRTHGCRNGPSEPDVAPCKPAQGSCGENEVWSYGAATQVVLEKFVIARAQVLKPYVAELAVNVSARGVPTMRPLWWDFPHDPNTLDVNDQYMLGPRLLVAPVVLEGATSRSVVFPAGARWKSFWRDSVIIEGGMVQVVDAPLGEIPAYWRI
uniref:Glycoside hydrolase family 31 protein n=1 Tax=Haptolina brevifila TaxID=156173 RepID=A0A7S2FY80_9EUKA|mmetsp:Transcript_22442/g.45084  ORF Transcript_22442/g.45084 Transcript_22442/m.45084 type:complete len:685 (+) Transcript_22442:55-2109(+)|eukprot:CAMPEP_0174710408 /NCGR_PEP_ID=MMETSP1094-20130205/12057_1 /TAXON_ID=156173 /ORGANISM="Chrysochromulina brevifilum, Strain UTEX LB 985" /LENGTH=684 /DNA_ID=CAMNT_0015909215 /DNA_START=45 /DNA_END=2099 /DNA_ORIENTATION=-